MLQTKRLTLTELKRLLAPLVLILGFMHASMAEEWDQMWLNYQPIENDAYAKVCRKHITGVEFSGDSDILNSALEELVRGLTEMMGEVPEGKASLWVGLNHASIPSSELSKIKEDGFLIRSVDHNNRSGIVITATSEQGLLYGVFGFLRQLQVQHPLENLSILDNPKTDLRMLNHWDDVFHGTVTRGYSGNSLFTWPWSDLSRLKDYARFLASTGINGTVINNVNTSSWDGWKIISEEKLRELKPLSDLLSSYGIKLYFSINFSSPVFFGDLDSADPLEPAVRDWWKQRADLIYEILPGFGGFLVKADSEGEPGPASYGRNHAEAANMLGEALAPHGGIVFWRAFVYNLGKWVYELPGKEMNPDRAAQAYEIFKPFDGRFADNVILQIKNGTLDFQPREPVAPLFGQMPDTRLMVELQITQEYTGFSTHLCYLVPQWKYYYDFDLYSGNQPGSPLSDVLQKKGRGVAGVSNFGTDSNWTGHTLAQANAFGFGRLAWNPELSAEEITDEWIQMTFGHSPKVLKILSDMLLRSWNVYEMYANPLGGSFFCDGHHFSPDPANRTNYHGSDETGIGTDRSQGKRAYSRQYSPALAKQFLSLETTPEELLAWFHHVPYDYEMKDGRTVIQYIYDSGHQGAESVKDFIQAWDQLKGEVDPERHEHIAERLRAHLNEAYIWRNAILNYYLDLSGIPDEKQRPVQPTSYPRLRK